MIPSNLLTQVTAEEIKRDFPIYLRRVEAGEKFIIVRAGKPLAEIKPVIATSKLVRPYGLCADEFRVPDDFDDPLPEAIIQEFEGR